MFTETEISGIWHNKYGSELKLEVDSQGKITGKFRTAVGRPETKHIWKDRFFDVVGILNGNLISLIVDYGSEAKGLSNISGKLVVDKLGAKSIETLSQTRFSLAEEDSWREISTAAITYFPGPSLKY